MSVKTIAICASQVPFRHGGAEILVDSLQRELARRGFQATIVQLPFKWYPRNQILKSCVAWRLLDLTESDGQKIDLVIATKFPSYAVKHPNKVTWLVHQFRQVYDQIGTTYSDFTDSAEDRILRDSIVSLDNRVLRESIRLFTIAHNPARRLKQYNNLNAEPIYHPPKLSGLYRNEEFGDYVFAISRLDRAKRLDLVVRAMSLVRTDAKLVLAGTGPDREQLERLIEELDLHQRVRLVGYVSDDEVIRLYARCCAVVYAPFDEDYGYVTLEAFSSAKPVITTRDSGGVLEFVEDEVNGFVTDGEPRSIATRIDELWLNRIRGAELGREGFERIKEITWDHAIDRLVER
jgi:glycosyltransferase involved in cell wall biosynthesis